MTEWLKIEIPYMEKMYTICYFYVNLYLRCITEAQNYRRRTRQCLSSFYPLIVSSANMHIELQFCSAKHLLPIHGKKTDPGNNALLIGMKQDPVGGCALGTEVLQDTDYPHGMQNRIAEPGHLVGFIFEFNIGSLYDFLGIQRLLQYIFLLEESNF